MAAGRSEVLGNIDQQAYESSLAGSDGWRGERRQVTALFYDIADSTHLMTSIDPERFRALQRMVHMKVAAEIRPKGGYLEHVLGDGGFVYFGFPQAAEDAAHNAVAAGLAIAAHFKALESGAADTVPIKLRIGIATGMVILGRLVGDDLPDQDEIIGRAPNLAARIQALAEANSVAVSDETYGLTRRRFDYVSLGQHDLKGFPEPAGVWQPVAPKRARSRFLHSRDTSIPFQARRGELALAYERWRLAASGRGQILLLYGDAGIGKSRFLHEFQQSAGIGLADTCLFQFAEATQNAPLSPILEWAQGMVGAFVTQVAEVGSAGQSQVAQLCAELLRSASVSEASEQTRVSADALRIEAISLAAKAIIAQAAGRPQLVILEDIHWADSVSRDVVAALIDAISELPVMVCVSSRDEQFREHSSEPNVAAIHLGRLDRAAITEVVRSIWGDGQVPAELPAFVFERSDGVPLFAEELGRLLHDRRHAAAASPLEWSAVQDRGGIVNLQDLLDARLAALGPLRRIAQAASVIGRDFNRELLAHLVATDGTDLDIDAAVENLIDAGIFERRLLGRGRVIRFRHALLRDAAYGSLLQGERRRLHQAAAEFLGRNGTQLAGHGVDLAHHLEQAGETDRALVHLCNAARQAGGQSALAEANSILNWATRLLPQIADPASRRQHRLAITVLHGPIAAMLEGTSSGHARAMYADAIGLCDQLEMVERVSWFPVYWGWWYTAPNVGEQHRRAKVILDTFSGKNAQTEVRLQAYHCAWAAGYHVGDHATCEHAIHRGLSLYDPEPAKTSRDLYGGHDTRVCGLGELAQTYWCVGRAEEARTAIAEAVAWAESLEHVGSRCHALDMQCLVHFYLRDRTGLKQAADRLGQVGREHELPAVLAKAEIYSAWADAADGSNRTALRRLSAGLETLQQIATEEDFPLYTGMVAEAEIAARNTQAALGMLREAIRRARQSNNLVWVPELLRLQAVALSRSDVPAQQWVRVLENGIALSEEQGAHMLTLRGLNAWVAMTTSVKERRELKRRIKLISGKIQKSFDLDEAERLTGE